MEYNYTITEGELLVNNARKVRLIVRLTYLFRILKLLLLLLTFGITIYTTYLIFRECITDATLAACIPLGSIFATFGSAVISVISLYCNKQISLFQEKSSGSSRSGARPVLLEKMALHEKIQQGNNRTFFGTITIC